METKLIDDQLKHLASRTKFLADQFIRAQHQLTAAQHTNQLKTAIGLPAPIDEEPIKMKLDRTRKNYINHIKNHIECL